MTDWHWRGVEPKAPEPEPGGPRPIYPDIRADMLTMLLENGEPEFVGLEQYQQMPPERRARCRAAHVAAGMTRYGVGVCFDGGDHIADPHAFLPILQEIHAAGLGPQVWACPEDVASHAGEVRRHQQVHRHDAIGDGRLEAVGDGDLAGCRSR